MTHKIDIPSEAIHAAARAHIGTTEWPGARHNPDILAMFEAAGQPMADDETPWCAAFAGAVLAQCGLSGTGSLTARSYLKWGVEVQPDDARPGDIVVLWRGSRNGWQGHVGFFDGFANGGRKIRILGGNQGNAVSIQSYDRARLLGIRRAHSPRKSPAQSTTLQASVTQVAAAAGTGATALAALDGPAQIVALAFAGTVALAAMWILRERLRKWGAGDR